MANKDPSRLMRISGKLLALNCVGALAANGYSLETHTPSRGLQTATNVVFIEKIKGSALVSGQENAVGLQLAEGLATTDTDTSVAIGTDATTNEAEYEIWFSQPTTSAGTTGFTVSFVGDLDGAQWNVDMYEWVGSEDWVNIGNLGPDGATIPGVTAGAWSSKDINFPATTSAYTFPTDSNVLIRVYTDGTQAQAGFLDQVGLSALGGAPTPTPGPVTSAPVPAAPGTPGTVKFIGVTQGSTITADQAGGAVLLSAEASTSTPPADTTSVAFGTGTNGKAEYEVFFTLPGDLTGATELTVNVALQLGDGAIAADWNVDIYDFVVTNDWVNVGSVSSAAATGWSSVSISVAAPTPTNFVESVSSEILLRVTTTDGATSPQVVYFDQIEVVAGVAAPSPTPPPMDQPPVVPPSTSGVPVFVAKTLGEPVLTTQENGVALETAEGLAVTDVASSIEFKSIAGAAEYEVYFTPPATTDGTSLDVSLVVQLGTGATASNWNVDLYNRNTATDNWVNVGALSAAPAGETGWYTVTLPFAATVADFLDSTSNNEMLLRLHTVGATGVQSVYVDQIQISPGQVVTPSPVPAVTPAPVLTPVQVDLVPCILASEAIERDVGAVASAYLFSEFFKGFWSATQITQTPPVPVLDLTVEGDANHGKCNVVFVNFTPDAAQKAQLQDYSRTFKVRIVYFDAADTTNDIEVTTRLGIQQYFVDPLQSSPKVKLTGDGSNVNSVVPQDMSTDVTISNIFIRPMRILEDAPGVTIVAEYATANGDPATGGEINGVDALSAAIATYSDASGLEEMHIFFGLAWFDMGSWAWGHYIAEWGTKGMFQGERRFYLGAVVDDLFLTTNQWDYGFPNQEGPLARMTGAELNAFAAAEAAFNADYSAEIKTEHAFNGIGILDKVDSPWRNVEGTEADIALLPKGQKPSPPEGITPQLLPGWLGFGVTGMQAEFAAGGWNSDDLLAATLADLNAFYWQSHTLTHLARDNLGVDDCDTEDGGNAQIAVLTGMFGSDNYNWRSMTSPGITGLFNEHCLRSGALNLMTCYPGDNTFDGVQTTVSLVNSNSQFHSLKTTVATNGRAGSQIVPRWATNVYFNCVTGECLILENEKIRRDVCGCTPLDPRVPITPGSCTACANDDISSFGTLENLFQTEEQTTTRYILSGRRDKYMFHQANVVSTSWTGTGTLGVDPVPPGNPSLLEYWYIRVLAQMAKFINTGAFPIKTLKFDNLCQNFDQHEILDNSEAIITTTLDTTGAITGVALATIGDADAGTIPLTIPTTEAPAIQAILTASLLEPYATEVYGADTTFYFAKGSQPPTLTKPNAGDLAPLPTSVVEQSVATSIKNNSTASPIDVAIAEDANDQNQSEANEQSKVIETGGNTIAAGNSTRV